MNPDTQTPTTFTLLIYDSIVVCDALVIGGQIRLFAEEQITALAAYGEVLRTIRARLLAEGYFRKDGTTWKT
jgi:hypothetical protein